MAREELFGAEITELPLDRDAIPVDDTPEDEEDLQGLITGMMEEAVHFRDDELDELQTKATDYYHARPFGNEEEGRSQVVSTDVRDVVAAFMPSLMRIFFGPERVVVFEPTGPEDEALAMQKTDYINHIVTKDNKGFLTLHSAFKDALVRKLGVIKWWWEEETKVEGFSLTGISETGYFMLASEDSVEVEVDEMHEDGTYDCTVKRRNPKGRARIAAVPPEEFVFSPHGRSQEESPLVAHVRDVPAAELIGMGYPRDVVDKHKGESEELGEGDVKAARRFDAAYDPADEDEQPESMRPVRFTEAYIFLESEDRGWD